MAHQKYDLLGKKFGKWTVLERTYDPKQRKHHKGRTIKWRCVCECGNEAFITTTRLIKNHTTQCRDCAAKLRIGNTYGQLPEGEASFNSLYDNYRRSAKNRGITFNISKDVFRKLTKQKCFYCGALPSQTHNPAGMYNGYYIYNGLDRKINTKGYVKENCVPCCKICNYMKRAMDFDEFINRIQTIYHVVGSKL